MGATLTTAASILKVRYLGPIREQVQKSSILLDKIKKDSTTQSVSGKSFTVPLHTGRNKSAGLGRAESSALATPGQQAWNEAVVPNKYIYTGIRLTGQSISASRDNVGAFASILDAETNGATRDMKKAFNRQIHGDGRDALGFWTTASDATTPATIDDNRGNAFTRVPTGGVTLDLIDATDNATKVADSIEFTLGAKGASSYSLAWSSGTVSSIVDDGDYLVYEDTLGYQMMGIDGIISTANPPLLSSAGLHALPVATYPWWTSQVSSNSGTNRALTLRLMQTPLDDILTNSDYTDKDVEFILTSPAGRTTYADLLVADKRYVNTITLDGGWEGLDFGGKPVIADPDCRLNVYYYINTDCLRFFEQGPIDWMDRDGNMFARVAGYDLYDATLFWYGDLGCVCRNGLGKLDDITMS